MVTIVYSSASWKEKTELKLFEDHYLRTNTILEQVGNYVIIAMT